MSAIEQLSAMSETTSDSAKTVHILEIVRSFFQARPVRTIMSISSSRVRAIISRKRPVPAAHLSFITKLTTLPSLSMRIILLSCPPISTIVRIVGSRKNAPFA